MKPERRLLHPLAWWVWALGLAVAASRTTNVALLILVIGVTGWVVAMRRDPSTPNTMRAVVMIGAAAIVIRVLMHIVFGGSGLGSTVLIRLPVLPLPDWAGGMRIGGPVSAEGLTAAATEGLRLAAMLVVLGAANALASPRRLLRYLPASLDDVGTTLVVGLAYAPALAEDAARVRRARRLRGRRSTGIRDVAAMVPVILDGALDRALALAASMDCRGYGRRRPGVGGARSHVLLIVGAAGALAGLYALLDAASSPALSGAVAAAGIGLCAVAVLHRGRTDRRSRYRRDQWALPETITVLCGIAAATAAAVAEMHGAAFLAPNPFELAAPSVPLAVIPVLLVAALPGWATPLAPEPRGARRDGSGRAGTPETPAPRRERRAAVIAVEVT